MAVRFFCDICDSEVRNHGHLAKITLSKGESMAAQSALQGVLICDSCLRKITEFYLELCKRGVAER